GGQQGTWTITVRNRGGSGPVVVRKPLGCGRALVRSSPPARVVGGVLVWRFPNLRAAQTVRIRVTLRATGDAARRCRVGARVGGRQAGIGLRVVARPQPRPVAVTG
ncbi:MAG: hypothetical protein MUE51_08450, partial [Thermoleophilia bacterium]|nr:hypothetical protein [Thermoleophilia bacterium]